MDSKENPWYHKKISGEVSTEAKQVLEGYSHIHPNEVEQHIYRIVSFKASQNAANLGCRGRTTFQLGYPTLLNMVQVFNQHIMTSK